jgi:glycosyltransferase involved in cell wall biosynthesis
MIKIVSKCRPVIAMDLSTNGKGGGPYTSTNRVISSKLKESYDFRVIDYKIELGRGISIKRIIDLAEQIKSIGPDIVHFTGLQLSGFHMAVACKLAGISNSVVTVHGFSGDSIDFNPLKRLCLQYFFEPLTLLLVKKVYGVSAFVASRRVIRLFSWKSLGHIYNFPPHAEKQISRAECRRKFGFQNTDIVIVSIARINKEKGYHILEAAIQEFKFDKNVKFLIAGEGNYLDEMKSALKEQVKAGQVIFLGYRKDIEEVNMAGDMFVLPTLHETLSIALLEASLAKLALIASDTGGVPEIVETNLNGILVPPGDSSAIVSAIKRLTDDDSFRLRCGVEAYKKLKDKFDNDKLALQLDNVYSNLLK